MRFLFQKQGLQDRLWLSRKSKKLQKKTKHKGINKLLLSIKALKNLNFKSKKLQDRQIFKLKNVNLMKRIQKMCKKMKRLEIKLAHKKLKKVKKETTVKERKKQGESKREDKTMSAMTPKENTGTGSSVPSTHIKENTTKMEG